MSAPVNDDENSWESESFNDVDDDGLEGGGNPEEDGELENQIATKETEAVFRIRSIVFLVLVASAVAVCLTVFYISRSALEDEYRSQYDGATDRVIETFHDIVENKLGAVSSLGVAMIAHGVDFTRDWPFVTLTSFQQRATTALSQSGCLFIKVAPEVIEEKRLEWEQFTVEDSDWM